VPCAAKAVVFMIMQCISSLKGKKAVVIGDTPLVGRPTAHLLRKLGADSKLFSETDKNAKLKSKQADIVVVDVRCPKYLEGDWIKPGAIIIDGGMNVIKQGNKGKSKVKIVGDVDIDSVLKHAGYVSPVPGGAGPLTIAMLVENTMLSWRRSISS